MIYHFVRHSGALKLGGISAVRVGRDSCPDSCPLKDGPCYGEDYRSKHWWDRLDAGEGISLSELLKCFRDKLNPRLFRWGSTGDLPGNGDKIDFSILLELAKVWISERLTGIIFSHKPLEGVHTRGHHMTRKKNRRTWDKIAAMLPFALNVSCDSYAEAVQAHSQGLDAVVIGPSKLKNHKGSINLGNGVKGKVCWAVSSGGTCGNCPGTWCAMKGRPFVVVFPAHGSGLRILDNVEGAYDVCS